MNTNVISARKINMDTNAIYLFYDKKEQKWIVMGRNFRITFSDPKEAYDALVTITGGTSVVNYIKQVERNDENYLKFI